MTIIVSVYLLSLTGALYLLRGMLEFPAIGWRFEVRLTVAIGVGLLPALAALAAADTNWGRWIIVALSALGCLVNVVLLIRLWQGLTVVATLTMVIAVLYLAAVIVALR